MCQLTKTNSGISLIELLLVIAIISILGVSGAAIGQRFLVSNYLENKTNELVSVLRTAQLNAMSGKENSQWGVSTSDGKIILFKGSSYVTRDTAFDVSFSVPASLQISNNEVVFAQVSGDPDTAITYSLSTNAGTSHTVAVNEVGVVNVD